MRLHLGYASHYDSQREGQENITVYLPLKRTMHRLTSIITIIMTHKPKKAPKLTRVMSESRGEHDRHV